MSLHPTPIRCCSRRTVDVRALLLHLWKLKDVIDLPKQRSETDMATRRQRRQRAPCALPPPTSERVEHHEEHETLRRVFEPILNRLRLIMRIVGSIGLLFRDAHFVPPLRIILITNVLVKYK